MRALRPGIVVTVTALAACAAPKTRKSSGAVEGKPAGPLDFAAAKALNPRDAKGRVVFADGEKCFVQLPFSKPPKSWQPHDTKQVDCPDAMNDPAWDACAAGRLYARGDGTGCVCVRDGNPPPPNVDAPCPK